MPNAYSSLRDIANLSLEFNGLKAISTDEAYANASLLDKYQRQTVIIVNMVQNQMALELNKRAFQRKFTIQTVAYDTTKTMAQNKTEYDVPGVIIEGLIANSFYNVTVGDNAVGNRPISLMTREAWRDAYPRPDLQPPGFPEVVIPVEDRGDGITRLMVWPWANAVYTIEGIARIVAPRITSGNQRALIPYWYEHAMVVQVAQLLETRLNEGREQSIMNFVNRIVETVLRDARGADEEIDPVDLGFRLYPGGNRDSARDYNPATDVVPPYP